MDAHNWIGAKDDGRSRDTTGGAIVDSPVFVRPAFPSVGPMGLAAQGLTDTEYAAIHLRDPDVPGIPEWLRDSIRRVVRRDLVVGIWHSNRWTSEALRAADELLAALSAPQRMEE